MEREKTLAVVARLLETSSSAAAAGEIDKSRAYLQAAAPLLEFAATITDSRLFHVRLESFGYQKINVIKAMREIVPGLGLKMAKDLVEAAPATLRDTAGRDLLLPEEVAHQHVARLRAAGARADVVEES